MKERLSIIFESEDKIDAGKIREYLIEEGLVYKSIKREPVEPLVKSKSKGCCGGNEPKSPSMLRKAKNYIETKKRWVKAGMPIVDIKTLSARLSICGDCESLKGYECTECGCPMDNKAKMDIDKLCELKKW